MKKENKFATSGYYLAITLLTLGEELFSIERTNDSKRAFFIFKESPTLKKNIENFRQGKILVEPQALFMQHKSLKSRLYNNY